MSHPRPASEAAWDRAGAADASFFLDFRGTIADPLWFYGIESDDARTIVDNMSQQTLRLAPELRLDKNALEAAESAIMGCEKLRTWATSLEVSGGMGCELWRLFYRTNFIGDLEQAVNKEVNREWISGGSDLSLQNDCHEFLRYSALHFFKNAHKVQNNDDEHSGAQDARFYVSFSVDGLPAFETVPPDQIASWRHLLQSNILDIFFDTTAQHLAKLGFERNADVDPDTTPPATKAQSNAPNSLIFPFFVAGCDEHSGKCSVNSDKSHSSFNTLVCPSCLPVSVASATALEILQRLEGVAESDEESSSETGLPKVIAMTFGGKHVAVWAVDRIDHTDLQRAGTCIWSGDVTRLRDCLELTVIFDKIAAGAATTFRSWVSKKVAQWMSLFPPDLAEGEEDEQVHDLGVRIGNLRISRTDSFKVNGSSKSLGGPIIG